MPGGDGCQQWDQHSPCLRARFSRVALTCPALSSLSCSGSGGWSCRGSAELPGCPACGAAAPGTATAWHCYKTCLQKNPNRQWEMPKHGWFLGVFFCLCGFGFCGVFVVFCFFFSSRFWSRTRGLLACWGGQRHTLVVSNTCLYSAAELKGWQSTDLACSVIWAHALGHRIKMISAFVWPFKMRSMLMVLGYILRVNPLRKLKVWYFSHWKCLAQFGSVSRFHFDMVGNSEKYICSKENGVVMETSERGGWHGEGRHQIRCTHGHTETASSCKVREQFLGTVCFMGGFSGARGEKKNHFKTVGMWRHLLVPKQSVLLWV